MSDLPTQPPQGNTIRTPSPLQTQLFLALGLFFGTLFVFWPALHNDFINYDDDIYVTANPWVQHGLTLESIRWALTTGHAANWHPLTWISHIIDFQLYGLNPFGHHLTNVLLHCANVLLLFFIAIRLTQKLWPCAVFAALFAWHPLRVESVAWVAERKDVLSAFFGLFALWFYVRFSEEAKLESARKHSCYRASLFCFALALMSKPMLVTLPFLFLLLDFWPLRRLPETTLRAQLPRNILNLVAEKLPFFALSIAASVITLLVQKSGGATRSLDDFPLTARLSNALVSYVAYLWKMFWPTKLAVLYPHTGGFPILQTLAAAVLLLLLSIGTFRASKRFPFLIVGWLWFLGSLVPVIGLVQVGMQSMADRYTYLPSIGIGLATVWLIFSMNKRVVAIVFVVPLLACVWGTRLTLQYWTDSRRLFERTVAITDNNYLAYNSLGNALQKQGEAEAAIQQFVASLKIKPDFAEAHNNLGNALHKCGKRDEALQEYLTCLKLKPNSADAHYNLGNLCAEAGRTKEAIVHFEEALKWDTSLSDAHNNLGALLHGIGDDANAEKHFLEGLRGFSASAGLHMNYAALLLSQGRIPESIHHYSEAARLAPENPEPRLMLGRLLASQNPSDAILQFQQALRLRPDWPTAMSGLAWLLATHPEAGIRNGSEAVRLAQRACELTQFNDPKALDILGAAYAETGRFQEALDASQKAQTLAETTGKAALAEAIHRHMELYKQKQPFRQP